MALCFEEVDSTGRPVYIRAAHPSAGEPGHSRPEPSPQFRIVDRTEAPYPEMSCTASAACATANRQTGRFWLRAGFTFIFAVTVLLRLFTSVV